MISIEKSAKTVKEAIRLGCEELGCDAADVDIEVLEMGAPGLFGMFAKHAKVRLTRKDSASDFDFDVNTIDSGDAKPTQPARKKRKPQPQAQPQQRQSEARPLPKKQPKPRMERSASPSNPTATAEDLFIEEPFVITPDDALSADAKKALAFLSELAERMSAPVTLEACESPEQLRVRMSGDNMNLLIGRRGETLDSVQYLTSLCVNRGRENYMRVSLDMEDYRAKRIEALRKLAARMAARAVRTGKRVALEPMNPYERRILHASLQTDPSVATHSEGEEPYRRVIITLK